MSEITNKRLNPVWHSMLYSCTHMATVGVRGLNTSDAIPTTQTVAVSPGSGIRLK